MKPKSNPFLRSALLVASLAFGITHTAFAVGNVTWNSGASADWNIAGNWTAGVGGTAPPAAGDSLIFDTTSGGTTLNNDITALSIGGLTFNSGASAFTLNGNSITLAGNITNNAANTQKIGFAVDLASTNRNITSQPTAGWNFQGHGRGAGSPSSGSALTFNGAGTTAWTGNWSDTDISMAVSVGAHLNSTPLQAGLPVVG